MRNSHLHREGAAHDINGIMARAMLLAERLRRDRDASVPSRAARIERAIDQVAEMCRRELAQDLSDTTVVMNASEVERTINQIAELVRIESELGARPIQFLVSIAPDVEVFIVRSALFRILFNLTLNAANAISKAKGSWIEISVMGAWGSVFFDICDDGPGLPQSALDYLYPGAGEERPANADGRGSGLITAASLAKSSGGDLKLIKSSASGAHFCLTIPEGDADQIAPGVGEDERTLRASTVRAEE